MRRLVYALIGLGFAVILGAPFLARPPRIVAQPTDRKLVIVSPHWEGIKEEFEVGFAEYYKAETGETVDVEWLDQGGAPDIIRFLTSEFKRTPDSVGVDIFYGGGTDPFIRLAKEGYLQPYRLPDALLSEIPPDYGGIPLYADGYTWYGAALSGFGIIYNKLVIEAVGLPTPKTWADLAEPSFISWVGTADPSKSGSTHMMYEIILQAYGWKEGFAIITAMGGNARYFAKGSNQVPKDVSAGEVACGLCIDFYAGVEISEVGEERVAYVMPEGVTVINPDSIAIIKGAPNRDVAESFMRFVLSEEGQRLWLLPAGVEGGPKRYGLARLPVVPSVYEKYADVAAVKFNPFRWKTTLAYDAEKGSVRWTILNDFLSAAIIQPHKELVRAWKLVSKLPRGHELRREFDSCPLSEGEVLRLAAEDWSDAEFRAGKRSAWGAQFRRKYEDLASRAQAALKQDAVR